MFLDQILGSLLSTPETDQNTYISEGTYSPVTSNSGDVCIHLAPLFQSKALYVHIWLQNYLVWSSIAFSTSEFRYDLET